MESGKKLQKARSEGVELTGNEKSWPLKKEHIDEKPTWFQIILNERNVRRSGIL